jgi:serine phosphatase RsbU (regulator of sigma subunit)
MISVTPERRTAVLRLAGHPAPLLITPDGIAELDVPACPPIGFNNLGNWPESKVELGERWSLLLYTDGLIEGRISGGPYRLGSEGLMGLLHDALGRPPFDPSRASSEGLLNRLIEQVSSLNSGDLDDDIAIIALGYA